MNTASKTRHVFILFLADIVWGIAFVAQDIRKLLWNSTFLCEQPAAAWNQHGRRIRQGWLSYSYIYTYGAYTWDFP